MVYWRSKFLFECLILPFSLQESALQQPEMLPEVHFLDVTVRQETLAGVRGDPVILQLPIVPCYALTVHKTQAAAEQPSKARQALSNVKHDFDQ